MISLLGCTIPELLVGAAGLLVVYGLYRFITRPRDLYADLEVSEDFRSRLRVVTKGRAPLVSDVSDLVHDMRTAFRSGITRSLANRVSALQQLEKLLVENQDELMAALEKDLHAVKGFHFTTQISFVLRDLRLHMDKLYSWAQPQYVSDTMSTWPSTSYTLAEPYGVVLIIGTWNFPITLSIGPLVGAISAGNTCIVKMSNTTSACSELICRLAPRYLPPEIVTFVGPSIPDDGVAIKTLMKQKLDYVMYTGGSRWAKDLLVAAAEHLTPMTLELGGKNPVYVSKTADIDRAAKRIVNMRMLNAGQVCVSPDYVMCEKSVVEELQDRMVFYAKQFFPTHPTDQMERIVNDFHTGRLESLLREERGTVLFGGLDFVDRAAKYIPPTIIRTTTESPLMKDEIFGPICLVMAVDSPSEFIHYVTSHSRPLALYVFSEDKQEIHEIVSSTSSGGVCVNHCFYHMSNNNLPFGGVGRSGYGAYCGKHTFEMFSHLKPVLIKRRFWDFGLLSDHTFITPPFTATKLKVTKMLL